MHLWDDSANVNVSNWFGYLENDMNINWPIVLLATALFLMWGVSEFHEKRYEACMEKVPTSELIAPHID